MSLPTPTSANPAAAPTRARVQWDYEREEPYISIPDFPSLRLTPLKNEDAEAMTEMCNHPQVGKYAFRRPYPYFLADAQWFLDTFLPDILKTASAVKGHLENGTCPAPLASPMAALRYVPQTRIPSTPPLTPADPSFASHAAANGDPEDPLADLGLTPGAFLGNFYTFPTSPDPLAKQELTDDMASRRGTVHDMAYDLMPTVWGRGLGWRCVKAMLEAWSEWVGVEVGVANVEATNAASLALVRKCGFVHTDTMTWQWPMEKGGGERTVLRYEWRNPKVQR